MQKDFEDTRVKELKRILKKLESTDLTDAQRDALEEKRDLLFEKLDNESVHYSLDEEFNNEKRERMKTTNLDALDICKETYDIPYSVHKGYKYTNKYSSNVIAVEKDSNYATNYFVMLINGDLMKDLFDNVLYWKTLNDAEKDICNLFSGNSPEHHLAFK